MRSTRPSTARLVVVMVMVLGGFFVIIAGAVQGDPESKTLILIFLGLIAVQATVITLSRLYWDIPLGSRTTLVATFVSYACTIGMFAMMYSYFDRHHQIQRPSSETPLTAIGAFYLSVANITGLGFTDRYPIGDAAKVMSMAEVLAGLGYAVFIFSILVNIIRRGNESPSQSDK